MVLPANEHVNHRHVLRSADHMKPLIVGISGFSSAYETVIEIATASGPIPPHFINFLEDVPTSYVVIENNLIEPQRRIDYETFLARAVLAGRLRFIKRFVDRNDDLYAVALHGGPPREWVSGPGAGRLTARGTPVGGRGWDPGLGSPGSDTLSNHPELRIVPASR